jgi:hypothetical protein
MHRPRIAFERANELPLQLSGPSLDWIASPFPCLLSPAPKDVHATYADVHKMLFSMLAVCQMFRQVPIQDSQNIFWARRFLCIYIEKICSEGDVVAGVREKNVYKLSANGVNT